MTIINWMDPWEQPMKDADLASMSIDSLFQLIHEMENRINARGILITEQQRQLDTLRNRVITGNATITHLLKAEEGRNPAAEQNHAGGKQTRHNEEWESSRILGLKEFPY